MHCMSLPQLNCPGSMHGDSRQVLEHKQNGLYDMKERPEAHLCS